jgi:hypothetical protein
MADTDRSRRVLPAFCGSRDAARAIRDAAIDFSELARNLLHLAPAFSLDFCVRAITGCQLRAATTERAVAVCRESNASKRGRDFYSPGEIRNVERQVRKIARRVSGIAGRVSEIGRLVSGVARRVCGIARRPGSPAARGRPPRREILGSDRELSGAGSELERGSLSMSAFLRRPVGKNPTRDRTLPDSLALSPAVAIVRFAPT